MHLAGVLLLAFVIGIQGNPISFNEDDINNKESMLFPDGDGKLHLIHLRANPNEYEPLIKFDPNKHVHFQLYTRKNPKKPQLLVPKDLSTVKKSNFDPAKHTFFISHGWKNKLSSPVNELIRKAYLDTEDVNVIVVDWEYGASYNYLAARGHAATTGKHLGKFISLLKKNFNVSLKNVRLVGHSLGSHVSGFAGKTVKKITGNKVAQIVGLDPALPLYSIKDPEGRLSKNDAEYVEIIHTNGGKLGFWDPLGHADFYPNLGYAQPGCGTDISGSCAHARAYKYFAESIERSQSFRSKLCSSMEQLSNNKCPQSSNWFLMGGKHYKPVKHGLFYLKTKAEYPFALGDAGVTL
ncbi:phospholipase A1-like [Ctenocephalides felis]|uniref:phospholipase A1-like n=1 Tax=Ctenocephalides felis TaxID=7515 RepID=UPI000E6E29F1|nr:phospholipase A1-like [Ctenocephalides felis]